MNAQHCANRNAEGEVSFGDVDFDVGSTSADIEV